MIVALAMLAFFMLLVTFLSRRRESTKPRHVGRRQPKYATDRTIAAASGALWLQGGSAGHGSDLGGGDGGDGGGDGGGGGCD